MTIHIRPVILDDADSLIVYVQSLARELDCDILLEPNEFQATLEEEQSFISSYLQSDNSLFLVAHLDDGSIVGALNMDGGRLRSIRHVVSLGISVAKNYRNQGIGRRLMQSAIEWAKGTGFINRVELQVTVRNAPALHLYRKFGFLIEGRKKRALHRLGMMHDVYCLALLFDSDCTLGSSFVAT